jgi:hypothetical protein
LGGFEGQACLRQIGIGPQGSTIFLTGIVQPAEKLQSSAQLIVRLGPSGVLGRQVAELVGCLVELTFLKQGASQVKACLTEIRLQFERFSELLDGCIPFFLPGKLSAGPVRASRLVAIDLLAIELIYSRELRPSFLCITLTLQ